MPTRFQLTTRTLRPLELLLLALATTFVAEYAIMKLLPRVLPDSCGATCEAIIDACLLTLIVAPVLLWTAVLPLQRLSQSRVYFLQRALTSQENERQRITREIHDGIGQSLTSLLLGLRAMEETTTDARTRETARSLRELGAGIHDELRRTVQGLRPAILDQLGLAPAVLRLIEDLRKTSAAEIELDTQGLASGRLDNGLESNAYRILQEAVTNAIRHASAGKIKVTIRIKDRHLELMVTDDGKGFDISSAAQNVRGGYGILSIRERAMICDGTAELTTTTGGGTTVFARLPLQKSRETDV